MITYLTQLTICWTILFAVYYLFLKRETFFAYNRWFLLSGLIAGLVIPLIDWTAMIAHEAESIGHIYVAPVQTQVHQLDVYVATSESTPLWYLILTGIYTIGALAAGIKLFNGIREIWSLRQNAQVSQENGYDLILTNRIHMPFSFLNGVYWSGELYRNSAEKDRILAHEVKHVSALHSLDILFIELLCVLFWFHPMVYIYRKEIKEVHEYEADAAACVMGNKKAYGQLLLNQAGSGLQLALANHFFYSQLKNRFKMMTRKPSHRIAKLKYLIAIPIIGLAALVFSFSKGDLTPDELAFTATDTVPPANGETELKIKGFDQFGFRQMEGKFKKVKSANNKYVIEFEYSRADSTESHTVSRSDEISKARLILDSYGHISYPKISGNSLAKLEKEAMFVLQMTKNDKSSFLQDIEPGKEVVITYAFPKKYWLSDSKKLSVFKRTYPDQNYLEIMAKSIEEAYLIIDDKAIGVVQVDLVTHQIALDEIYSISNKKSVDLVRKYKIGKDLQILDIKTKTWADNNPDKIRRGFKTIVGRVVDMEGKPIVGANVMIKGTRTGSTTDFNGEYRLPGVDKNDELIFSTKDGRNPREFPVGSDTYRNAIVQFPTVKLYPKPMAVEEVYQGKVVDALPRFPGCEDLNGSVQNKTQCAEKKFLTYLYENIRYPALARTNNIQGQAIATFTVKKDGSVDYVHIIKDPGAGLGEEVEQLLKKMNSQGNWTPAIKDGKPINFEMTLPVIFKLKGEDITTKIKKVNMDKAVNPLSEIVVVALSDKASKTKKTENEVKQNSVKKSLDEIVVVGYGKKSKNIDSKNNKSENSSSGLVITGHPLKNSPISIDDLPPLIELNGYVIGRADGTRSLKYVNPENIESISVLKGEKAIEQYGDRGKSGVIIITTKEPVLKQTNAILKLSSFNLYPNPTSNELTVEFAGPSGDYRMEVIDAKGATQLSKDLPNRNHGQTVLNVSALNSGIYYLIIKSDSKTTSKVFVKE